MSNRNFYADLPAFDVFIDITYINRFTSVPSDWYVIITDIIGSTEAIESGRYKDVNFLGACSIIAVLNVAEKLEIPFVFGGDGASILIPADLLAQSKQVLLATRQLAQTKFDIDLRVGAVSVAEIMAANYDVKVAKYMVSPYYTQAIFTGGGLNYATELIKNPDTASLYNFEPETITIQPDFSGLECRWQDIFSNQGETVSLIVMSMSENPEISSQVYRDLLQEIMLIYGDESCFSPIPSSGLKLSFNYKKLLAETKIRAKSDKLLDQILYLIKIFFENLLGTFLIKFKIKLGGMDWGQFKNIFLSAIDNKKFDDTLRMVIAGNALQRERLTKYLESKLSKGELVYGLHISDRALMTCIVFERNGRQVHFVDGADGGYAAAAKAMKKRIKNGEWGMGNGE